MKIPITEELHEKGTFVSIVRIKRIWNWHWRTAIKHRREIHERILIKGFYFFVCFLLATGHVHPADKEY